MIERMKCMRSFFVCFAILMILTFLGTSLAEAPVSFEEIPLQLPGPVQADISYQNGYLVLKTDWQPVYDEVTVSVRMNGASPVKLSSKDEGVFKSEDKISSHTVTGIDFKSTNGNNDDQEYISQDVDGQLLFSELSRNEKTLTYTKDSDKQALYTYTVKQTDTDLPYVEYCGTYRPDGTVISYRESIDNKFEITCDPDGNILQVDAFVRYEDGSQDVYRITWDSENACWYNKTTSEIVEYPPYVEEDPVQEIVLDPVDPAEDEKDPETQQTEPSKPGSGADDAPDEPVEDHSSSRPYQVSAPPLRVKDLKLAYSPEQLHHLKLGRIVCEGGVLSIEDHGYTNVTLTSDRDIPMALHNGRWSCPAPDGEYGIQLTNGSLFSQYTQDGRGMSVNLADTALSLLHDGKYAYNGDGRENVVAYYAADGNLESYSYHNADESKSVTYDPYGEVLFYRASSSDGFTYRYMDGQWERQEKDGTWSHCRKPEDVNPSDLPPLLLLERKRTATGTWYPNNTVGVIGVSLRDRFPALTRKWYHVLPVDLTQQGTQSFKLVASNLYYIGRIYVTVHQDSVTVQYAYSNGLIFPKEDMFRWFTSMDQITHEFLEKPEGSMEYGRGYSISEELDGAQTALLFVCNRVTYRQPIWNDGTMLVRYWPNIESVKEHRKKAEDMLMKMSE